MSNLRIIHSILLILAILSFSASIASAQYVGNGGALVPAPGREGDTVTTLYRDAVEFLKKGECKKADRKLRKVLDKVPRNSEASYLRGIAHQCLKDYEGSLHYFRRAKRDDAQFYRAYEALGVSALALGSRQHAQAELDELKVFIDACGRKCPEVLRRSYQELGQAIEKFDGVAVQSPGLSPEDPVIGPKQPDAP
jgi:tetratricopeptide (TPR) repeat protein